MRELRDIENKDYLIDKNFLSLKQRKELFKPENPDDPNQKYANMSYINFLNKQQRMLERGQNFGDADEDDENQSEEDSN